MYCVHRRGQKSEQKRRTRQKKVIPMFSLIELNRIEFLVRNLLFEKYWINEGIITLYCCCDSCVDCARTLLPLPAFYVHFGPANFQPNRHPIDGCWLCCCASATSCSCRSPFLPRHMFACRTNCHLSSYSSRHDWPFWKCQVNATGIVIGQLETHRCIRLKWNIPLLEDI